ncbi:hypothetical protein [Hydrogenophaga sp.]|uniref:hypothetical protein n=1 Tax=Hydrogenophaga sp. TaxID=1904254 RepID=UPI00271F8F01|nr:hypothetical protein [Hydrogenophaga sp.]MDO9437049.1 hypothetical protein [Hydrogenophaga sp.]
MPTPDATYQRLQEATPQTPARTSDAHGVFLLCCGVPVFSTDDERRDFCRGAGQMSALAVGIAVCAIAVLWATGQLPL